MRPTWYTLLSAPPRRSGPPWTRFLLQQGAQSDPFRINLARNKVKEWYVGDGWYSDGPKFSMDNYNSYVMHPMNVALREKLPEHVKPAQVRCALTAVHRNMYEGNQNFDANGWLVLGFNGHQPECADGYTSTGSLYMATLSFLPLGLPADNPFWTDPAVDWTSKRAWKGEHLPKDYKVEY